MTEIPAAPAGWYRDESLPAPTLRWWNGTEWTNFTQPGGTASDRKFGPTGEMIAGRGSRLGAAILDFMIVSGPVIAVSFAINYQSFLDAYSEASSGQSEPSDDWVDPLFLLGLDWIASPTAILEALLWWSVLMAYNAFFLRWRAATIGKSMMGLRVRPADLEANLTWSQILRREGSRNYLFALLGVVGFVDSAWLLWDKRRQTLHDKLGGTVVVVKATGVEP